jgi:hypothetical protein
MRKVQKHDVFCQLGSAPFEPTENLIARSQYWDLATFTIPEQILRHWDSRVFVAKSWPPPPLAADDDVVFGGYPEVRRSVPPRQYPPTMSIDFVSFRGQPHRCSADQVSFHVDSSQVRWLPNVAEPLEPGTSLSGMSGGPCFRLIADEDRIELGGFIYEGDYALGIVFARQANLISATRQIMPATISSGQRDRQAT